MYNMIRHSINHLTERQVVDDESSKIDDLEPKRMIQADHMNLCRFSSTYDVGYVQAKQEVESFVQVIVKVSHKIEEAIRKRKCQMAGLG